MNSVESHFQLRSPKTKRARIYWKNLPLALTNIKKWKKNFSKMCSNLWDLPYYASLPLISARERASFTYFTCQCAVTGYRRFITGENQLVGRLALDKGTNGLQSFIISTHSHCLPQWIFRPQQTLSQPRILGLYRINVIVWRVKNFSNMCSNLWGLPFEA